MKPLEKVRIVPSAAFYYAIGLITTDGSLSKDRRHIVFTSKDVELIETFQKALGIHSTVSRFANGITKEKKYYRVQFGDV